MANKTIDPGHLATAKATHARDNPPADPARATYDYAAQIAAANPVTLEDARRLRKSMIEGAHNREQRAAIAEAWSPVLDGLARVE